MPICLPILTQSSLATDKRPKNKIQYGDRRQLNFQRMSFSATSSSRMVSLKLQANFGPNRLIVGQNYTCLCIFKMAASTILNFTESCILDRNNPHNSVCPSGYQILRKYLHRRPRYGRKKTKSKITADAILNFERHFRPTVDFSCSV